MPVIIGIKNKTGRNHMPEYTPKSYAILLAAGMGNRTGFAVPKQLIKLKNKEIILHSLEIFLKSKINFESIVLAVPPSSVFNFNWKNFFEENMPSGEAGKLRIVTGGATRQESVANSVKYIESIISKKGQISKACQNSQASSQAAQIIQASAAAISSKSSKCPQGAQSAQTFQENPIVFIHDSARPFVTEGELNLLLKKTAENGAAFLYSEVTETIKTIEKIKIKKIKAAGENEVPIFNMPEQKGLRLNIKTLKRSNLISAKTPQVFKYEIIKNAIEKAAAENFTSTDDVSLVENIGISATPVMSNPMNIKITSAIDLEIAELLLSKFDKRFTD